MIDSDILDYDPSLDNMLDSLYGFEVYNSETTETDLAERLAQVKAECASAGDDDEEYFDPEEV